MSTDPPASRHRIAVVESDPELRAGSEAWERLAAELGLAAVPSAANFVCFDIGAPEEARRVLEELLQRGVFVRMPSAPPQSRCIRVTVGTGPQRAAFAGALREILEETRR